MPGSLLGIHYAFQFLKVTYCPPGRWNQMLSAVINVDIELTAVSGPGFAYNVGNPGFESQKCINWAWLLMPVILALGRGS